MLTSVVFTRFRGTGRGAGVGGSGEGGTGDVVSRAGEVEDRGLTGGVGLGFLGTGTVFLGGDFLTAGSCSSGDGWSFGGGFFGGVGLGDGGGRVVGSGERLTSPASTGGRCSSFVGFLGGSGFGFFGVSGGTLAVSFSTGVPFSSGSFVTVLALDLGLRGTVGR